MTSGRNGHIGQSRQHWMEVGPFRLIIGRYSSDPWWRVVTLRRLWSVALLPHGVDVRCRAEVPSWVRIGSIAVSREGHLDWTDSLIIKHRPKWWCFWREWRPDG